MEVRDQAIEPSPHVGSHSDLDSIPEWACEPPVWTEDSPVLALHLNLNNRPDVLTSHLQMNELFSSLLFPSILDN